MVQVLHRTPQQPKRSFGQEILGTMQQAANKYEQYQNSKLPSAKEKEIMLTHELQGKNQLALEAEKLRGKKELLGEKQNFIKEALNKATSENENLPFENQTNKGFKPENLSDEDIIEAEALGFKGLREAKNAAVKKIEGKEKENRRQFESDRAYHTKTSEPILKAAEDQLREAPIRKALISQQRRDISSGNTEGLIPFLVDKLGLEAYRNPESARFKSASKERFVESLHTLGSAGARPNQFIEQQLVAAQPTLGRSEEANQSVLDLEEFINDLKEKRAQIELELAEKDYEKFGYPKNDIGRRADKLMKDYAEERQDKMAYDIRSRHENKMSDSDLVNDIVFGNIPEDTPITERTANILLIKNNHDKAKARTEAKRLGFRIGK